METCRRILRGQNFPIFIMKIGPICDFYKNIVSLGSKNFLQPQCKDQIFQFSNESLKMLHRGTMYIQTKFNSLTHLPGLNELFRRSSLSPETKISFYLSSKNFQSKIIDTCTILLAIKIILLHLWLLSTLHVFPREQVLSRLTLKFGLIFMSFPMKHFHFYDLVFGAKQ